MSILPTESDLEHSSPLARKAWAAAALSCIFSGAACLISCVAVGIAFNQNSPSRSEIPKAEEKEASASQGMQSELMNSPLLEDLNFPSTFSTDEIGNQPLYIEDRAIDLNL